MPHLTVLNPLSAALDHAERGFSVIPLARGSKRPALEWKPFQTKHATPDEIRAWWAAWPDANVGIVTGAISKLVVIDLDGPDGQQAFFERCKREGFVSPTPRVATGNGEHAYYQHPGSPVPNRVRLFPEVDIRADGGYVVAPGSVHENGRPYTWLVSPDKAPFAPLPGWVLDELRAPAVEPLPLLDGDMISEGMRNDTLYRLARSMHARRASARAIHAALTEENAGRCHPPLEDDELETLIDHALSQPDRLDFAPQQQPVSASARGWVTLTAPAFMQQEFSAPAYLVDPLVPSGGVVFFHGKKGLGKSPLTWALALAVARGEPFFGLPTKQGRVLYIEVDTPMPQHIRKRLGHLPQPLPSDWVITTCYPFDILKPEDPARANLRALAEEHQPDLVIINTLRKVHRADDKESDVPSRVYGAFQRIFPGSALWFVHHDKKSPSDPSAKPLSDEMFSGTQAWINDATVGLHLVKAGDNGLLRLEHTKSQVSQLLPPMTLVLPEDGSNIRLHSDRQEEAVLEVFASLGPSLTKRERVRLTSEKLGKGFSQRTIWDILGRFGEANPRDAAATAANGVKAA